ncbi:MAG: helix-turn-helix domain-containing protein [Janthinobacterium lividum]
MQKRFITLTADERATLSAGRQYHQQYQFRDRCHGLLLSADGQAVVAIMAVLDVSRQTVYSWFNRWEEGGLAGLANAAGQGRRPILIAADEVSVAAAVRANRQQLKDVTATLRQELAKDFSPRTLRRFLKSAVGRGDAFATA